MHNFLRLYKHVNVQDVTAATLHWWHHLDPGSAQKWLSGGAMRLSSHPHIHLTQSSAVNHDVKPPFTASNNKNIRQINLGHPLVLYEVRNMTETLFGDILFGFYFEFLVCPCHQGDGFMTYTARSHQGAIKKSCYLSLCVNDTWI